MIPTAIVRRFSCAFLLLLLLSPGLAPAFAAASGQSPAGDPQDQNQDQDHDKSPLQVGYAVITPTPANKGLVVFETFGEHRGLITTQAGVLPPNVTNEAILFVSTNGRLSRNLGVAIVNLSLETADVTLTLRKEDGTILATKTIQIDKLNQTARYVTELFSDQPSVPRDFTGTLDVSSDKPIAVIGLRFRGINFSTLPATSLGAPVDLPSISDGVGDAGAVILPQFASGGGWASEIIIVNSGTEPLVVRVDLFQQNGDPLQAQLNGETKSTFDNITVPAGGVVVLSARNKNGDSDF